MTKPLYLGVSRRVITPKIGTHLYGYAPGWPSTSVNDDLTLTAFYFKQEDTVSLLISLTVCSIAQELSDSMRTAIEERFGISKNACIIHAIHTHSGPNLAGSIGWGDLDTEYRDKILLPAFFDAVEEAIATPIPVTMAVTCGDSYIGINRRELAPDNTIVFGQNPWGVFDPRMTVIAFCKEDGKAFANLIHYAVHCTAAGKNPEITRDLAGVMIDTLEAETGAVTAFINGAEGDIGPRLTNGLTVGEGDIRYAMRLGAVAGQDAVRIYNQPRIYVTPELRVSYRRITIPYSKRIPLAEANEQYEKFRGETINVLGKQKAYYKSIIESYENGYEDEYGYDVNQTILRLGDVAIVTTPFEPFAEIALRISKHSKLPYTLLLSNANGHRTYFPAEDDLCRGGYEVVMFLTGQLQAPLPNADWYFITQTVEHLNSI